MRRASWRPSLAELLALAIAITAARCSTGQFSDALGQRSGWRVEAPTSLLAEGGNQATQVNVTLLPEHVLDLWWEDWKLAWGKRYRTPGLESAARRTFAANMREVLWHNSAGRPHWLTGNQFSDLSDGEFESRYLGVRLLPAMKAEHAAQQRHAALSRRPSPQRHARRLAATVDVDWRRSDKVTPPRTQGACGVCWAMVAAAALESMVLITQGLTFQATGLSLAEQQLISCVNNATGFPNTNGCAGGVPDDPFKYARRYGLATERAYGPYLDGQPAPCDVSRLSAALAAGQAIRVGGGGSGYRILRSGSEEALMRAVDRQPVAVVFEARPSFRAYGGGVYAPQDCRGTDAAINHALLVVGYHFTGSAADDWWLVKNSWGEQWGEGGYARIQMDHGTVSGYGDSGACGILRYPLAPTMELDAELRWAPPPAQPAAPPPPLPPSPGPPPSQPPLQPPPAPGPPPPSPSATPSPQQDAQPYPEATAGGGLSAPQPPPPDPAPAEEQSAAPATASEPLHVAQLSLSLAGLGDAQLFGGAALARLQRDACGATLNFTGADQCAVSSATLGQPLVMALGLAVRGDARAAERLDLALQQLASEPMAAMQGLAQQYRISSIEAKALLALASSGAQAATPPPAPGSAVPSAGAGSSGAGLPAGAIAGAVVSSVLGAALLLGGVVWWVGSRGGAARGARVQPAAARPHVSDAYSSQQAAPPPGGAWHAYGSGGQHTVPWHGQSPGWGSAAGVPPWAVHSPGAGGAAQHLGTLGTVPVVRWHDALHFGSAPSDVHVRLDEPGGAVRAGVGTLTSSYARW